MADAARCTTAHPAGIPDRSAAIVLGIGKFCRKGGDRVSGPCPGEHYNYFAENDLAKMTWPK
jgi:hypothetical protein